MPETLFLAGATSAIGRRLVPLLLADGWRVAGTTRTPEKAAELARLGVQPVVIDVFDGPALADAMARARPTVVVHQLTDLAGVLDPARRADALARNARLREAGTANLVAAAVAAGVRRLVAQSIAFAYAPGPLPHREDAPLAAAAPGPAGASARGGASLERQVLAAPLEGIVLRYGRLYGPGTGVDAPAGPAPLHVDAAAEAARLAARLGAPGIYNLAEDDGTVSSEKATRSLGWDPAWRP